MGAEAKSCKEFYPWITPICGRHGTVDAPCWTECRNRHGPEAQAYCMSVVDPPLVWCACIYPCDWKSK